MRRHLLLDLLTRMYGPGRHCSSLAVEGFDERLSKSQARFKGRP